MDMVDKLKIREFIQTEIMKKGDLSGVKDSDSLIESGIIDSLGIQILLEYLEKSFSVSISDDELVPENFESIDAIAEFIGKKQAG
ncbi:acyl carrier protein [Syntrophus aciditrophicus SB]|uniref:Acyl carrier protein n=2 Tax=Syntrophus TaxID=43773 RepID=Q2LPP9_SYNAS|nr:acyl carrier protein [Syntrophus aciditrophicus SB]